GGLSTDQVHVWSTNVDTRDAADDFIAQAPIEPQDGVFTVELQPGHVYSITTTTGQQKGGATPPSTVFEQMPLPYEEDFEGYEDGDLARYYSDINGGFEVAAAGGDREGKVYRQMVTMGPITWGLAGAGMMDPTTIMGDPRWWGDYELRADVLLEQEGYVELLGRLSAQAHRKLAGLHLRIGT